MLLMKVISNDRNMYFIPRDRPNVKVDKFRTSYSAPVSRSLVCKLHGLLHRTREVREKFHREAAAET